jgi:hypothetical protein
MENEQIVDMVRGLFVKVISFDRLGLVETLNKDGFPTNLNADEETLINSSLMAMQVSEKFRDDLAEMMLKYADTNDNYKSFAPYQNDMTESLAPQGLMGNEKLPDDIFYKAPLFAK